MLKCIAIDDEPIALNIIESYCQQHGEIQLETFTSPQEGMNRIKEISPDIVFMDIEMTGYSRNRAGKGASCRLRAHLYHSLRQLCLGGF